LPAEEERDQRPASGYRQVGPGAECGRRQRVDEDVAQDAAAEGRDHAERQHPDDVKLRFFQACDRAVERERERAGQVKREQQRRFGHDCQHASLPGRSRS
jgi:hypothetical protein